MSELEISKLSEVQHRAIRELLLQPSVRRVAGALEVDESTVYRWLKEPNFKKMLDIARADAYQVARDELCASCVMAVATLRAVMADPGRPASARVMASVAVLRACGSYGPNDATECKTLQEIPRISVKSS